MGYSDQKYLARPIVRAANLVAFGTATAAGTASNSLAQPTGFYLPPFVHRTKITGLKAVPTTAASTGAFPVNINILNGTATLGTLTVAGTASATQGQVITGVITNAANSIFAANSQATMQMIGTFTASGATTGVWDIYFEQQEQPDLNS